MIFQVRPRAPEIPIIQLPPVGFPVRDWGGRRAAWWQRMVFFALIAPVAIPIHLVWRGLVAGWRKLSDGRPEYSSILRGGHVYWYEYGKLVDVHPHRGSPPCRIPDVPGAPPR